jgi:hypothetical protein
MPIAMGEAVIIAALIGLFGSILIFFLNAWKERRKLKLSNDVIEGMRKSQIIYSIVEEIVSTSSTERGIIFAGHNSGGIPRPSSSFWVSSIYWHARTPQQEKQLSEYQKLEVDSHYISNLLDCERRGMVVLSTEKMPSCLLKRYYEAEGVQHSIVFFLKIVENKFLYLSVAKYDATPYDEKEITKIDMKVGMIRSLI